MKEGGSALFLFVFQAIASILSFRRSAVVADS
jgi:hypothetical protein